ncbi:hypothetical protein BGX29_002435, partial [Mortierella sp. GBA35]
IGGLTKLGTLYLRMVQLYEQGQVDDDEEEDEPQSFPAMLSLGDVWEGRPGYLHHLAELKNLETLQGTVGADTE